MNCVFLVIRASHMLAPISLPSHPKSSVTQNQQHSTTRLPTKLRKIHNIDFVLPKITTKTTTRKHEDNTQIRLVPSPVETQQNVSTTNQISNAFLLIFV